MPIILGPRQLLIIHLKSFNMLPLPLGIAFLPVLHPNASLNCLNCTPCSSPYKLTKVSWIKVHFLCSSGGESDEAYLASPSKEGLVQLSALVKRPRLKHKG